MNDVKIFVTPIDVAKWKLFQKHYDTFSVMHDSGVFNVRSGSVALHFDSAGILQVIQRADQLYKRKHDIHALRSTESNV